MGTFIIGNVQALSNLIWNNVFNVSVFGQGTLLFVAVIIQVAVVIALLKIAYIFRDVKKSKMAQQEVIQQKNRLEALFKNSFDAIVLLDNNHHILDINENFTKLFNYTIEEVKGQNLDEVISKDKESKEGVELTRRLLQGEQVSLESIRYCKNNEPKDVGIKGVPVIIDGKVVGGYGIYTDISERKKAEQEILYISYHDQLTGIHNRRYLEKELKILDTEENLPMSMIMIDVNGLKLINDAFGHMLGDKLLVKVAGILKENQKGNNIVARLGGDEFIIVIPKSTVKETEDVVEQILEKVKTTKIENIDISVSIGWDIKYLPLENIEHVFKKAEDYMYRHKLLKSTSRASKTIESIIENLHGKNEHEFEHSKNVSLLCEIVAKEMGLSEKEIIEMITLGYLHDIGKIALDETILNKQGPLTKEEIQEIRRHSEIGYNILRTSNDTAELADFVLAHHENWDGSGYPKGLRRQSIPLQSRILRIAEVYDNMTSTRPYKKPLSKEDALNELIANKDIKYDPEIVDIFIEKISHKL